MVIEPTKDSGIFLGWFTQNSGGEEVKSNTVVTCTDDHTLFARWQLEECEIEPGPQPEPQQPGRQRPSADPGTAYRPPTLQILEHSYEAPELLYEVLGYQMFFNERFVVGFEDGTFRPMNPVTRAEATAFLVRTILSEFSYGTPVPSIDSVFNDVESDDWFYLYLVWAYTSDLVSGYLDGTFRPNNPITREEFASIIARTTTVIQIESPFADAEQVSDWAQNSVNAVFHAGWMVGDAYGRFLPTADITRAEAIATIGRIIGRNATTIASIANVIDDIHLFNDITDPSAWFFAYIVDASNSYYFDIIDGVKVWTRIENN